MYKKLKNLLLLLLLITLVSPAIALQNKYYSFDAGSDQSIVIENAIPLYTTDVYSRDKGFGWVNQPTGSFVRKDLLRSRDDFDIDGIIGKNLTFRADLPNGRWWITVFMEAGLEDSATTQFNLNGKLLNPGWQSFRPNAEGRNSWLDVCRVFHWPVTVENTGLQLEIIGNQDSVRVLGLKLYPDPLPVSNEHEQLLMKIKSTAKFTRAFPMDSLGVGLPDLINKLENLLNKDTDDVFAQYWHDQLLILQKAENYIKMMGWEWETDRTGLNIFDRYPGAAMLLDGLLNLPEPEKYPLYERALWQRGRVLFWLDMERHGIHERETAIRDMSTLYSLYPDNKLLAMYNGEKIKTDICNTLPNTNAPQWSVLQNQTLCYLRNISHWWVQERQALNGEFGGKLGDDVELLRAFPPLVLSGDTVAYNGWKKLADCVWNSGQLLNGFAKDVSDVEHASELVSDVAPEMVMYTDDEVYLERLHWSADYFENLWTGFTPNGSRFFKSSWFSSTRIRTDPPRNRDVEMNSRAVKAVRYLAWKSRDPHVIKTLDEWSQAWVKAAMRTDKDKPAGIIPASICFSDESINGTEPTWYDANMYWDYYNWRHNAGSMILDQLLFTFTVTNDSTLLLPLLTTLKLIQKYESINFQITNPDPGSEIWAVKTLISKTGFWNVVEQWRLFTNNNTFDDLILKYGTPYVRFRLTGETSNLVAGLEQNLEYVQYNFPLLTSEVLHTDRVYLRGGSANLGTFHLNAMLTGSGLQTSPYNAVSWENTNNEFTALVTETGKKQLSVDVFSHSDTQKKVVLRIWQLAPGQYNLVSILNDKVFKTRTVTINAPGERVKLDIPGQQLVTFKFRSVNTK